ncbi:hypothetical protein C8R44DRAFT_735613 [Mycena epipterygia]|nr:hypothetical protein C8R44DRAFT_735613 [Mycena epipterygia]
MLKSESSSDAPSSSESTLASNAPVSKLADHSKYAVLVAQYHQLKAAILKDVPPVRLSWLYDQTVDEATRSARKEEFVAGRKAATQPKQDAFEAFCRENAAALTEWRVECWPPQPENWDSDGDT